MWVRVYVVCITMLCDMYLYTYKRAAILLQVEHRQTRDVYISLLYAVNSVQSTENAENILYMQLQLDSL